MTAEPVLRESLSGLGANTLIRRCAQLPEPNDRVSDAQMATAYALRVLADRILTLTHDADELEKRIRMLVDAAVPELLERQRAGPDSAAALLIAAGDNSDRIHGESSFAALCGVSPVEASSGKRNGDASTVEATVKPTPRCTGS